MSRGALASAVACVTPPMVADRSVVLLLALWVELEAPGFTTALTLEVSVTSSRPPCTAMTDTADDAAAVIDATEVAAAAPVCAHKDGI